MLSVFPTPIPIDILVNCLNPPQPLTTSHGHELAYQAELGTSLFARVKSFWDKSSSAPAAPKVRFVVHLDNDRLLGLFVFFP
jgi:hypothetical protein